MHGLLVLELGQVYNGPYCGLLLRNLGADVVKIEPPSGDPVRWRRTGGGLESHSFLLLNGGKRALRLDLKDPRGKALFLDLAAQADVVVENFSPGTLDRLGLGWDVLSEANPCLVLATGRGYGEDGPQADFKAMDLTVQAMTGLVSATGFPDGPPVKCGPSVADFLGGVHLATAVLAALLQRTRTGRGQHVQVAMQDAALPALASNLAAHLDEEGAIPERTGNHHGSLGVCPYDVYPAADGWVAILCMSTRHWLALCERMGRPDLAEDPALATLAGRVDHMAELDGVVAGWSQVRTRAEAVAELQAAGVPCAPVATVAEIVDDEQVRATGMLSRVQAEGRPAAYTFGSPVRGSDLPRPEPAPAPRLGEHTDEILASRLGLTRAALDELHAAEVL